MENNKEYSKDAERRKLQEDIERLQDVIGDDEFNSDEDSDNDALHIDVNSTGEDDFRQTPGGFSINSCSGSVIPEASADDQDGEEIIINLNENVPIDPDTCLALNKAYQEVLLDTLRSIEMALIENRDKQDSIQENLDENPKKTKLIGDGCKRSVTSYQRPFFTDAKGNVAPPTYDVKVKMSTEEQRQDIKPQHSWRKNMKNNLREAVYLDSVGQLTRSLVNRKEIYFEKISGMSKEAHGEEYDKLVEKIEDIDAEIKRIMELPKDEVLKMADREKVDWLKISNTVLKNLRDPTECELYWNNTLRPGINKSEFTKEEKDKLKELAQKHGQKNWQKIAKELGTNRTAFQCLQYYQQNLNDVFNKRPWTEMEDQLLAEVVENCKMGKTVPWTQVSYFIEGRSAHQCTQRWTQINPDIKRGKWSEEEDMKLLSSVILYGDKDWEKIAEFVPNRSQNQCRERYKSSLDPNLRPPDMWTYEEDRTLLYTADELRKEDGKIPWAKIAERMEGRTDNMILNRYRKLMEWKEKCEWLEKQPPKMQKELGYLDLEELATGKSQSGKQPMKGNKKKTIVKKSYQETEEDYRRLSRALSKLPVAEYKLDYIKQLQDRRQGNIEVPRPPIMYRYTRRSSTNVWTRKKQLKTLLETHLSSINITKPEERIMIPEKTAQEFKPFTMLDERQMQKVQRILQEKNPCEISVRELLEFTNETKPTRAEVNEIQQQRKNRLDVQIEKKICDILQYKHCYITKWRKPTGRPKKFYIFYPGGRKPMYFASENTVQLSTVTSTLLLNALEIDSKKAMINYHTLIPRQRKAIKPLYDLLCKCFPQSVPNITQSPQGSTSSANIQTPSKNIVASNAQANTKTVSSSHLAVRPVLSTISSPSSVPMPTQSSPGKTSSAAVKRKSTVEVGEPKRKRGRPRIKPDSQGNSEVEAKDLTSDLGNPGNQVSNSRPGRKRKSVDAQGDVSPSKAKVFEVASATATVTEATPGKASSVMSSTRTVTIISPSRLPQIVPLSSVQSTQGPVPTALITNSSTLTQKTGQQIVQLSNPQIIGSNTLKPGQILPTSSPRVIVLKQQPSVQNRYPILPPCVTTMRGYEELLLQSNLLKSRAGDYYNPYYYYQKGQILQARVDTVMKDRKIVSKLNINDKVDRALEQAARKVNSVLGGNVPKNNKVSGDINPRKDLLKNIRKTPEYIKLKKRFDALFMWPAFLSLLKPEKENFFDSKVEDKKLVTFEQWIEKVQKEERKNTEQITKIPDGIKIEKDQGSKKKYSMARGRLFAKYRQMHRDRRAQISMKRRLAKQMQMKSIAEKGREKIKAERKARDEANKNKKIERYKHLGQRMSIRLMEKKDEPVPVDIPEVPVVKPKLRSLKSLQRVMEGKPVEEAIKRSRKFSKESESIDDECILLSPESSINSTEIATPEKSSKSTESNIAAGMASPPQIIMVPMMLSPGQTGVNAGSGAIQGMVPMMMPQQFPVSGMVPAAMPPHTATNSSLTMAVPQQMVSQGMAMMMPLQGTSAGMTQGMMQPMFIMQPTVSSASATGGMPYPMFMMQNLAGTSTGEINQVQGPVSLDNQTVGEGQSVNVSLASPTAAASPYQGQKSPEKTLSVVQGHLPPPTAPLSIISSGQGQPVMRSPPLSTGTTSTGSESVIPITSESPVKNISPKIVSVSGADDSYSSNIKSVDYNSEMSHVFLGAVPGQESNPMLISVPKDSNMTVKELIQMMGNTSRQKANDSVQIISAKDCEIEVMDTEDNSRIELEDNVDKTKEDKSH